MARARAVSVVVFDVAFKSTDGRLTVRSVMRQLFGKTPAVQFHRTAKTQYQAGDFDDVGHGRWIGQLEKQARSASTSVTLEGESGFRFHRSDELDATTSESVSTFLFDERKEILVVHERGAVPYTRFETYVRYALRKAPPSYLEAVTLRLTPRTTKRSVRSWLGHFGTIESLSVRFRHSQSPGNKAADIMLEELNAFIMTETVKADRGKELNKQALLEGDTAPAIAIDHIDKNDANGSVFIRGTVDDEVFVVDTSVPVDRQIITVPAGEDISDALLKYCNEVPVRPRGKNPK